MDTSPESYVEPKNEKHDGIINIVRTKNKSMAIQRVQKTKLNKTKKDIAKQPSNVPVREAPAVPSYPASSTPGLPAHSQKDRGKADKPKVGMPAGGKG